MNWHLFLDAMALPIAVLATGFCWAAIPTCTPIAKSVLALFICFLCWAWIVAG